MICRPQKRDGRSEVTRSSTNTVSPIWVIIKRLNIPALSLRALLSWFILYLLIECALVKSVEAFWLDSCLVNHALWRLWLVFFMHVILIACFWGVSAFGSVLSVAVCCESCVWLRAAAAVGWWAEAALSWQLRVFRWLWHQAGFSQVSGPLRFSGIDGSRGVESNWITRLAAEVWSNVRLGFVGDLQHSVIQLSYCRKYFIFLYLTSGCPYWPITINYKKMSF